MILETLVTTLNPDGTPRIAPMGPWVDTTTDLNSFELRPFTTTATFGNLQRTREGVLHITDDVFLYAQAIVDNWKEFPDLIASHRVNGWIIADACRWVEFEVVRIDVTHERAAIQCRALDTGRNRDFWGFNRAKAAVIEAAILASRVHFLPYEVLRDRFLEWEKVIERTGGKREKDAFALLKEYVESPQVQSRSNV